jgi:hypothetical protein
MIQNGTTASMPHAAAYTATTSIHSASEKDAVAAGIQVLFKYLQTDDWQKGFVYSPEYNAALQKALLDGERTKTFPAWKKIIAGLGRSRAELSRGSVTNYRF